MPALAIREDISPAEVRRRGRRGRDGRASARMIAIANALGRMDRASAAREAEAKVAKARAALDRLRREKEARAKTHPQEGQRKGAPSVSLTDPEAWRMCFPDGAVRAGYNVQTAALSEQGLIVAVMTTDRRNDQGLACPLVDGVARRYGRAPRRALFDQGYAARADIAALWEHPMGP